MLFCSDQGKGTTIKASLTEKTCSSTAPFTQETDYESEDNTTLAFSTLERGCCYTDFSTDIQSPTGIQMDNSEVKSIGKTNDKDIQKRAARWRIRKLFRNSLQKIQKRERNERNMESYVIKRASNFRATGKFVSPLFQRTLIHPTHHARKISYLILFSTKGGQKDRK
jgi:hypothetical protein